MIYCFFISFCCILAFFSNWLCWRFCYCFRSFLYYFFTYFCCVITFCIFFSYWSFRAFLLEPLFLPSLLPLQLLLHPRLLQQLALLVLLLLLPFLPLLLLHLLLLRITFCIFFSYWSFRAFYWSLCSFLHYFLFSFCCIFAFFSN